MSPIEDQLRKTLFDNDVDPEVAERLVADFVKTYNDDPAIPDNSIDKLEEELMDMGVEDWRKRAQLAARIISKRLEIGY